jgi:hypothetical protein
MRHVAETAGSRPIENPRTLRNERNGILHLAQQWNTTRGFLSGMELNRA